jgi:hypothetical protein
MMWFSLIRPLVATRGRSLDELRPAVIYSGQ